MKERFEFNTTLQIATHSHTMSLQTIWLIVGHPEPEKKSSVGIFEYILASMLKVFLDVF